MSTQTWERERIGLISNILNQYLAKDPVQATDKALEQAKLFMARIEKGQIQPPAQVAKLFTETTIVLTQGWESMKAVAVPMGASDSIANIATAIKKQLVCALPHVQQLPQPQGEDDE